MVIYEFKQLPSTSTKAAQLLADGQKPPFAVLAQEQTAGRGTHGRRWLADAGNLFLSIALPSDGLTPESAGTLPALVGAWTAQYIQEQTSIRLTLKWPNDLVFAGKKVGGILCETSIQGSDLGPIIVGIGININTAPQLPTDGNHYGAAHLGQFCHNLPATAELGKKLANRISDLWQTCSKPGLSARAFADFAIDAGQVWRDRSNQTLWFQVGLNQTGGLRLANTPHGTDSLELSDQSHNLQWQYLGDGIAPLALWDAGNSRFKVAFYPKGRQSSMPSHFLSYGYDAKGQIPDQACQELTAIWQTQNGEGSWLGLSVQTTGFESLEQQLQTYGINLVQIQHRRLRVGGNGYDLRQLGGDRLALCEAAAKIFVTGPFMAISCGTAITIDVVDSQQQHLGGLILPGITSQLQTMAAKGAKLPQIDKLPQLDEGMAASGLGHNTREAMTHGALLGPFALIKDLQQLYQIAADKILLTGGDANCFATALPQAQLLPEAIMIGIREMALGGTSGCAPDLAEIVN